MKNIGNKNLIFFTATLIATLVILIFIIKPWQVDLRLPLFDYEGDNLFFHFIIKTIIDSGWFDVNGFVGMPYQFNFYDFPINADLSHIIILKILSYFSSNIYLIANCFFIIGFLMISATSFIALRSIEIEHFICLVVSLLYSFLPFHFYRNTHHGFIANYYIIPLVIMMSLWFLENKVLAFVYKNNKLSFGVNPRFYFCLLIVLFVCVSGIYYAYCSCVTLTFVLLIKALKGEKNNSPIVICIIFIILTSFYIQMPSFKYWLEYGVNNLVVVRSPWESERYGLKMAYLLLPIENHYLKFFANIGKKFVTIDLQHSFESKSESLGIVGSIGLIFSLLWLFAICYHGKNTLLQKTIDRFSLAQKDQNLISNLASLNLLSILFASVGGLVMLIAISFPLIRAHARFSVFIAFISLSLIGILLNQLYKKTDSKVIFNIALIIILLFAIVDQVGVRDSQNLEVDIVANDYDFVARIEKSVAKNSAIFILPIIIFPEGGTYDMVRPYLASKNLRWSSPAIYGRASSMWQEKIIKYDFNKFIKELKKFNFSGVYIDRTQYLKFYNSEELKILEEKLQSVSKRSKLISADNRLIFFAI